MYTKSVKWLTLGDILAEDIIFNNEVIIKKDTPLKIMQILLIQNLGLQWVKVKTSPFLTTVNRATNISHIQQYFFDFIIHNNQNNRYYYLFENEEEILSVAKFFDELLKNETIVNLLSATNKWDFYSLRHSIDTFILGSLWMKRVNVDYCKEDCVGFLLHDIGKIKVPREILWKNGKLTDEELHIIMKHPEDGANILKDLGFSNVICEMANYHHVRLNNTGYPKPYPKNLHIMVRATMIVDVFSALTQERPYREAVSFKDALDLLMKDRESYDQFLLESFYKFISRCLDKQKYNSEKVFEG